METRVRSPKYEKDSEPRFYTKVVALAIQFLDKKSTDKPIMAVVEKEMGEYEA